MLPTTDPMRQLCRNAAEAAEKVYTAGNNGQYSDVKGAFSSWNCGKLETGSLRSVVSCHKPGEPSIRLDIMAFSPASNPMDHWQDLSDNVHKRILLPNPTSEPFVRRCLQASIDPDHVVIWLTGYFSSNRSNWEVRLFTCPLEFAMTFADDVLFVRPYLPTKSGHFSPIVVLRSSAKQDSAFVSLFSKYFEKIWAVSTPVTLPYSKPAFCGASHCLARILAHDGSLRRELQTSEALERAIPADLAPLLSRLRAILQGGAPGDPLPSEFFVNLLLDRFLRPSVPVANNGLVVEQILAETWRKRFARADQKYQTRFVAIARFAVRKSSEGTECLGTGCLVAPGIVLTTRAVASSLSEWRKTGSSPQLDFDNGTSVEISGMLAEQGDLVLLRLCSGWDDLALPSPIPLSSVPLAEGDLVVSVGHGNTSAKEAMPGRISRVPNGQVFEHDCAIRPTHRGGEVILDIDTGDAKGIHLHSAERGERFYGASIVLVHNMLASSSHAK